MHGDHVPTNNTGTTNGYPSVHIYIFSTHTFPPQYSPVPFLFPVTSLLPHLGIERSLDILGLSEPVLFPLKHHQGARDLLRLHRFVHRRRLVQRNDLILVPLQ